MSRVPSYVLPVQAFPCGRGGRSFSGPYPSHATCRFSTRCRSGPPWVVRGRCKRVGRPRAGRLKRLLPWKHLHCPFEVTLEAMWGDTWRTDVMRPDI